MTSVIGDEAPVSLVTDNDPDPIVVVVGEPETVVATPPRRAMSIRRSTSSTLVSGDEGPVVSVVGAGSVPGPAGPQGIQGIQGIQGPPGTGGGGGDTPYVFNQTSPSAMWHIVHGRGIDPSVVVRRTDGVSISGFGKVYSSDANTVDIYFGTPISGVATLNF